MRRYLIKDFPYEREAELLLDEKCGTVDRLQVLDALIKALDKQDKDAVFVRENGQELSLDMVTRLRNRGFDLSINQQED